MRKYLVRFIAAVAAVCAVGLGIGPAFASTASSPSGTVTATVAVSQSITLTLNNTSFSLSGLAGTTASNPTADSYNVMTGDPAGFSVTITPASDLTSGSHTIPVADMTVNNGTAFPMTGPNQPVTVLSASGATPPSGQNVTDAWSIAIPASAATGSYTVALQYLAIAN